MQKFRTQITITLDREASDMDSARQAILRTYPVATYGTKIVSIEPVHEFKSGDIFINPANGILFKIGYNIEQGLLLFKMTQGINMVGVLGHKERVTLEEILKAWGGGSPHNSLVPCPWETYWTTQVHPLLCRHKLNTSMSTPLQTLSMFHSYGLLDLVESVAVYLS